MPVTKEGIHTNVLIQALARNIEERDLAVSEGKPYLARPYQNSVEALLLTLKRNGVDVTPLVESQLPEIA